MKRRLRDRRRAIICSASKTLDLKSYLSSRASFCRLDSQCTGLNARAPVFTPVPPGLALSLCPEPPAYSLSDEDEDAQLTLLFDALKIPDQDRRACVPARRRLRDPLQADKLLTPPVPLELTVNGISPIGQALASAAAAAAAAATECMGAYISSAVTVFVHVSDDYADTRVRTLSQSGNAEV